MRGWWTSEFAFSACSLPRIRIPRMYSASGASQLNHRRLPENTTCGVILIPVHCGVLICAASFIGIADAPAAGDHPSDHCEFRWAPCIRRFPPSACKSVFRQIDRPHLKNSGSGFKTPHNRAGLRIGLYWLCSAFVQRVENGAHTQVRRQGHWKKTLCPGYNSLDNAAMEP